MRTFGKVLAAIFGVIGKVLSFIFGTLGLWLPTVYSIIFLSVCGFSIHGSTAIGFYCGLVVCVIAGFSLSMYLHWAKKDPNAPKKKKEKKNKNKNKNTQTAQTDVSADGNAANQTNNTVPQNAQTAPQYNWQQPYGSQQNPSVPTQQYAPQQYSGQQYNGQYNAQYNGQYGGQPYNTQYNVPPQSYGAPQQNGYQPGYNTQPTPPQQNYNVPPQSYGAVNNPRQNNADLEKKYFSDNGNSQPERYERTVSFDSDEAAARNSDSERSTEYSLGTDELWRRLTGSDVPDEQPLVFRTRRDPDLYVYEYSDRYQYWRRTPQGMVFERTEYKPVDTRKP